MFFNLTVILSPGMTIPELEQKMPTVIYMVSGDLPMVLRHSPVLLGLLYLLTVHKSRVRAPLLERILASAPVLDHLEFLCTRN